MAKELVLHMRRIVFVGQAMPKVKRNPHDWPSLNFWLQSIGITEKQIKENFLYTALVDYFPGSKNGSHLVPSNEEIRKDSQRLKNTIISFDPEIIVPIGKLSISYCLGEMNIPLKDCIGKTYKVNPYSFLGTEIQVIPLPHPSGASVWRYNLENKKLLLKALTLIKNNLL